MSKYTFLLFKTILITTDIKKIENKNIFEFQEINNYIYGSALDNENIDLLEFITIQEYMKLFNNKSNNGNSLYLDNINIKNISSEEYNPLNFNLYPNPNYGNFSVEMENFEIEEINLKIIDTRGKLIVFNKYSFNDNSSRIINFSKSLAAGYYYIELSNSEKTIIQPFVVINE